MIPARYFGDFGMVPKKDSVISGCINRDISYRMMEVTVLLNSALVKLYTWSLVWTPWFKRGPEKLDPIERE